MAAGMGSRYGGLKQIDPMTDEGEIIIDFSLYDALVAGFEEAVFIIRQGMESDLRGLIDGRAGRYMDARYVVQRPDDLPRGIVPPAGREKPWGTCHAVWSAREAIKGPFAVINADDYYGGDAFRLMYGFLSGAYAGERRYAMVGYVLDNTLTDSGSVARGVCEVGADGYLTGVTERKKIMRRDGGICYEAPGGAWLPVRGDSVVSMNFWGLTPAIMEDIEAGFAPFFAQLPPEGAAGAEYLLPTEIDSLLRAGRASVKVLPSGERWYGVTYREDKPAVSAAMRKLKETGAYPRVLFG
jgi:hypothetical protein